MKRLRLLAPVLFVAVLVAGVIVLRPQDYLGYAALGREQAGLQAFVTQRPVAAALAYIVLYAVFVTLAIPLGGVMSVSGGLLFGAVGGSVFAVLGASIGGIALFTIARTVAGPVLVRRAGRLLDRVRPALQRDGFNTLLALRLLPVVPFWITNIAPALAGMRLAPFAAATVLGIVPGTCVFAALGAGLGDGLASGQRPDLGIVLRPQILLPLLGLAALALTPVVWRRVRDHVRHA